MMQQLFGDYRQKMHDDDIAQQKRRISFCYFNKNQFYSSVYH